MQVFDIEDLGNGVTRAVTSRPRDCTMCRECIRHEGWEERINLKRIARHFIFTVESTGCVQPQEIVKMVSGLTCNECTGLSDYLFCDFFINRPFKFFVKRHLSSRNLWWTCLVRIVNCHWSSRINKVVNSRRYICFGAFISLESNIPFCGTHDQMQSIGSYHLEMHNLSHQSYVCSSFGVCFEIKHIAVNTPILMTTLTTHATTS